MPLAKRGILSQAKKEAVQVVRYAGENVESFVLVGRLVLHVTATAAVQSKDDIGVLDKVVVPTGLTNVVGVCKLDVFKRTCQVTLQCSQKPRGIVLCHFMPRVLKTHSQFLQSAATRLCEMSQRFVRVVGKATQRQAKI